MARIMVLGAHPDDAEFFAGGLLSRHAKHGSEIMIWSVTNGQSGHQSISSSELVSIRREEAKAAGRIIGANYQTGPFPDGYLQPTLDLREWIIRQIRAFAPDLVLTHRPFDYHPDHRAVGQAVQDASYMVLVPKIVPQIAPPVREPLVAYMNDMFTRPTPFRPDVVLDVTEELDRVLGMIACHRSQFLDWMPWIERISDSVPKEESAKLEWLRRWYLDKVAGRVERFWGDRPGHPTLVEAFELSEYAGRANPEEIAKLFLV
jgi:N-acetylglucosamine malate deacetylase 1